MGLITNFLSIIIGGILGLTIGKKFNEDIKNIIVDCAGIFIMVIGIKSALVAEKDIMILIYLIIGAVIGQIINRKFTISPISFPQFLLFTTDKLYHKILNIIKYNCLSSKKLLYLLIYILMNKNKILGGYSFENSYYWLQWYR